MLWSLEAAAARVPFSAVMTGHGSLRPAQLATPQADTRVADPLDVVRLAPLMRLTSGSPTVKVALIDGPIVLDHPDLASEQIREIPGGLRGTCARANSTACRHGTFVAGILSAKRGSQAPAICPGCTLLLRPIFAERSENDLPSAIPEKLADAIVDAVAAGARVINVSAALARPVRRSERLIEEALTHAGRHGAIVVAAAGNERTIGGTALARHPSVIPVVACDDRRRPVIHSNLGSSIGRRGLSAPGAGIRSLGSGPEPVTLDGTSAAAPFVTGAIALLWSEFPQASAADVRSAVTRAGVGRRSTVVPPVLDAWAAHQILSTTTRR